MSAERSNIMRNKIFHNSLLVSFLLFFSLGYGNGYYNNNSSIDSIYTQSKLDSMIPIQRIEIDSKIHTPYLTKSNDRIGLPILNLTDNSKLKLHFDLFNLELPNLTIDFKHCDANWQLSPLNREEYIEGEDFLEIIEKEASFNTGVDYSHYTYSFPNNEVQFLLSGNYFLYVMDESQEDTLLQLPFFIVENHITINAFTSESPLPKYSYTHQALNLSIDSRDFQIDNPYNNLETRVYVNGRIDTSNRKIIPSMINGNKIQYSVDENLLFEGGKELRNIDLRDIENPEPKIEEFRFIGNKPKAIMVLDELQSYKTHINLKDFNGSFNIAPINIENEDIESEYVSTLIRLNYPSKLEYENIYIWGGFNHWQINDRYLLEFDATKKEYNIELPFKQGYYNYEFVTVPMEDSAQPDRGLIEGNSKDTENEYTLFIYTKLPGTNHDIIIGSNTINSRKLD